MVCGSKERVILVSGASGIVGYGILKSLKRTGNAYKLIGTSIHQESAANHFCDIFEKAPYTHDQRYIQWLIDLIKKHDVDMIIPSIEVDVAVWQQHREYICKETGVVILLNNPDLIRLCSDKWLFYQELIGKRPAYAIPTRISANDVNFDFPLLLKPRRGSASKGIAIVKNKLELNCFISEIGPNLMVQPLIGSKDEEYTTSAFFDKQSNLCSSMTLRRTLSKEGYTETASTVEVPNMNKVLSELAEVFMPVGPTNFQFRIDDGQLKLLEINPRISSATSIRTAFGYNESKMSVDYFLECKRIESQQVRSGYAFRYTEDIVCYEQ